MAATTTTNSTTNGSIFAGFNDEADFIYTGTGNRKLNNNASDGSKSFQKIPVIDFSKARSSSAKERAELGQEVVRIARTVGFFYARNHGISQELIEKTQGLARRFFTEQSLEEKMKYSMDRNAVEYYGYAPMRQNMPDGGIKTRMYETMHWGYEPSLDPRIRAGEERDYNFWPTEQDFPGFKKAMAEYYSQVFDFSFVLLKLFSLGLDLGEDYFDSYFDQPQVLLGLNHYPTAAEKNPNGSGLYAHADLEAITVLLQDTVNSLQVLNDNGDWIDAEPIPGTFVVNVGDTLAMWTNGQLKSTVHRVDNSKGDSRLSIPFFLGANPKAIVEPLPKFVSAEEPAKFEPVIIGEFHKREIHKAYPEGKVKG